jgi:hypothetical protein
MSDEVQRFSIPFADPRLGRHVAHDPKSWDHQEMFPRRVAPLRSVQHRRYDPRPEPNQQVGCCTMVSECMLANTKGNRVKGQVLDMSVAEEGYSLATRIDSFHGQYPPNDTGSSGLAAAKAAIEMGIAEEYVWYFNLNDFLRGLQEHSISFGGNWHYDMFLATPQNPIIKPTGEVAGGHQWVASGYRAKEELIVGECWWGPTFGLNGRFMISVEDFRFLFEAYGDAHFTFRKGRNG